MLALSFHFAGEVVNNHDELMSNFFAQPDALAYGKVSLETNFLFSTNDLFGVEFFFCKNDFYLVLCDIKLLLLIEEEEMLLVLYWKDNYYL